MKVIRPEETFTPLQLPVLIMDISRSGALIRVHPAALHSSLNDLHRMSFSLKLASGRVPSLRGVVVWSQQSEGRYLLGLEFVQQCSELETLVRDGTPGVPEGAPSAPLVFPHKTQTPEDFVAIEGEAYRASKVRVTSHRGELFLVPVRDGRFKCALPLRDWGENRFAFCGVNGDMVSPEVRIDVRRESKETREAGTPRVPVCQFGNDSVAGRHFVRVQLDVKSLRDREIAEAITELVAELPHLEVEIMLSSPRDEEALALRRFAKRIRALSNQSVAGIPLPPARV